MAEESVPTIILMPGSPFVMRVMAAMQSRGVNYDTFWVDLGNIKKQLPPPHKVPVLADTDGTIVADSSEILRYLDKTRNTGFLPNEAAIALDTELSNEFALFFFYYTIVHPETFERSFKKVINRVIPGWLQFLGFTPEYVTREKRAEFKVSMNKYIVEHGGKADDPESVMKRFRELLSKYNDMLAKSKDSGPFMLSDSTPNPNLPTGADCMFYGFLERMVGTAGDIEFPSSLPDILNDFPEIRRFHEYMKATYPIAFKGKRRSKTLPKIPIPSLYEKPPLIPHFITHQLFGR